MSRSQLRTGQWSGRKKWFPLENKPSAKKPPSPQLGLELEGRVGGLCTPIIRVGAGGLK